MGLFQSTNPKEKEHKGILGAFSVDVIKWEPEAGREADLISFKFPYEDFPNGSFLIVAPSQMAVFINNVDTGSALNAEGGTAQVSVFAGPCKIKLDTGDSRFAPFRNISHKLTGGESAFHSEVFFLNTTYMNDLKWGTQNPVVVEDPEEEVNIHVRAQGLFGAHIEQMDSTVSAVQARKFLQKVVGTKAQYTREELVQYMRAKILEYVPDLLAKNMVDQHVGILKISTHLTDFSQIIQAKLTSYFEDFGLTLDNFSFTNINAPDEDLAAINEMKIRRKQKFLEAEGNAQQMDIESEARMRMRQREGYTYQQEQSFNIMNAAASNEGMSANLMGAGMGLTMGLGMGGSIGAGMGAVAQSAMGNPAQMMQPQSAATSGVQKCKACGAPLDPGDGFCAGCGAPVEKAACCSNCGKELKPGALFCTGCGQKVGKKCPNCGEAAEPGEKFCAKCGTAL